MVRIKHRDLNKKSLESLIKAGVFDSLNVDRGQALENIEEILKFNQATKKLENHYQNNLFGHQKINPNVLKLKTPTITDKNLILSWEKEVLGLYLSDHPFRVYFEKLKDKIKTIKEIKNLSQQTNKQNQLVKKLRLAGIISHIQRTYTRQGQPMFFITLEDLEDKLEVLVFNNTLQKNLLDFKENKAIIVDGHLSFRNNELKFIGEEIKEI